MSLFRASAEQSSNLVRPSADNSSTRRLTWIVAATVIVATLIALGQIKSHAFLWWDDDKNFTLNPRFNPGTLNSLGYYWVNPAFDLYVPVTYTVWGVLALFAAGSSGGGGLDPQAFHVVSLVFHILAAIGVLLVLRRLGLRPWPAGFGALVFAVHPLQTEAVAWASGLKDVLSGGLCIWAIWFYLRAVCAQVSSKRWWTNYSLGMFLFILAMFSKPQAVCLPLVILTVELLRRPGAWRQWTAYLLAWFALTLPVIIIARNTQPAVEQAAAIPWIDRPLVALDDLGFYVQKLFTPIDLTVDYARSTAWLLRHNGYRSVILPLLLACIFLWIVCARARWLTVGAAIFVAALIPVLGFLPFDFQKYSNVADHYVYLAMLGPALIGACALQIAADHRIAKRFVVAISSGFFWLMVIATYRQASYWADNETLFSRNLLLQPQSFAANFQMARHYAEKGAIDQAIELYKHSLTIKPNDPEALFDLGNALQREGRFSQAADEYHEALKTWPNRADLRENLAVALVMMNKFDEATMELETANHLQPGDAGVLLNLAKLSMHRQDVGKAKAYLLEDVAANPNFTPAREMLQQIEQMEQVRPRP